ncbi:hypothetical protein B0I35DRAFT_246648 [Stachybotrys elegans]|uniref:LPXTG-domain-containing protein n=1 Tax=Stachybotrys elegans TaxID=80388 RepID=A0A8K0SV25_9HYPO|nr:hypothetical protein B0I35DRAFT_246648 [Stachybotrys elegans]
MLRLQTGLALVCAAVPAAHGVLVTPSSPCSSSCGNTNDATSTDEIVCSRSDYQLGNGAVFQSCVECELSSTYQNNGTSDTQMMLYNMRYATSSCLFGFPENEAAVSTPCVTDRSCGAFQVALRFGNLSTDFENYDYCAAWPTTDTVDLDACQDCLRVSDQGYLANFFAVLQAGCLQQPVAGHPLALEGQVFSLDQVNGTDSVSDALIDQSWFDHGPLSLAARVGIAVAGIVLLLSMIGCCIVWNGKRKRRAFLRTLEKDHANKGWPSPQNHHQKDMSSTPLSQRPFRNWDDSPMSATTDTPFPRYFSPYSSQFNSPVSAHDNSTPMQWPVAALGKPQEIGLALGDADNQWQPSPDDTKGKARATESYEMHHVHSAGGNAPMPAEHMMQHQPPVLSHPGYGRTSDSPPRQYSLDDPDRYTRPVY